MSNIFFKHTKKAVKFLKANGVDTDRYIESWYWDMDADQLVVGRYASSNEDIDAGEMKYDESGEPHTYYELRPIIARDRLEKLKVDEDATDEDSLDEYYGLRAMVAFAESIAKHAAEFNKAVAEKLEDSPITDEDYPLPDYGDGESAELRCPSGITLAEHEVLHGPLLVQDVSPSGVLLVNIPGAGPVPHSYVAQNFTGRHIGIGDEVWAVQTFFDDLVAVIKAPSDETSDSEGITASDPTSNGIEGDGWSISEDGISFDARDDEEIASIRVQLRPEAQGTVEALSDLKESLDEIKDLVLEMYLAPRVINVHQAASQDDEIRSLVVQDAQDHLAKAQERLVEVEHNYQQAMAEAQRAVADANRAEFAAHESLNKALYKAQKKRA